MEIQDISIALICDQYMTWLEQRQRMDLEVASEFVSMASHLVYIKTRMLLSIEDEEAQNEMDALIQSLEERRRSESYGKIKALAAKLEPMAEFGRNIVTRNPEPVKRGRIYEYDQEKVDLLLAMAEIQNRAERSLPPPQKQHSRTLYAMSLIRWKARPGRFCSGSRSRDYPGSGCCFRATAAAVR